jgi:hypothetical protein
VSYEWEKMPDVECVGYAEHKGLYYEFDEFMVLRRGDLYYWAVDTGCSCPSPFDRHNFPDDFESGSAIDALNALTEWSEGIEVEDDGLRMKLMSA